MDTTDTSGTDRRFRAFVNTRPWDTPCHWHTAAALGISLPATLRPVTGMASFEGGMAIKGTEPRGTVVDYKSRHPALDCESDTKTDESSGRTADASLSAG